MFLAIEGLITGAITGFLCGMFGMGGGAILIPVIVHIFKLPMKHAIGTSLTIIVFTSISSLFNYKKSGNLNSKLTFLILPFGIVATQIGALLTSRLPENLVKYIFIFMILSLGLKMLFPGKQVECSTQGRENKLAVILIGTFAGFVSGLCGVGGAVLIIPLFYIFLRIPMHACIGTALLVIFFNSLSGSIGYIVRGLVDFKVALVLSIGSMIAAPFGSKISINTSKEKLRRVFAVILILSGLSILIS